MTKKLGKITIFVLMLGAGLGWFLITNETRGLALTAFTKAEVETITIGHDSAIIYTSLNDAEQPNGIYRSDDLGYTWQYIDMKPTNRINALVVQPDNPLQLFAGTDAGAFETTHALWHSNDGGHNWQPFHLQLPAQPDHIMPTVTTMAIDPTEPESLYVGTAGQGIYRVDVGANRQGDGLIGNHTLHNAYVKEMIFSPDGVLYALTETGLFKNIGGYWSAIVSPDTPISLTVGRTNNIYVGTATTGLICSTDDGETWQAINDGLGLMPGASLRVTALTVDDIDDKHLVVATAYSIGKKLAPIGVYESYDGGKTWKFLGQTMGLVKNLTIKQGIIIAATEQGLIRYAMVES